MFIIFLLLGTLFAALAATLRTPAVYYSCIAVGVVYLTIVGGVLIETAIRKDKLLKAQWFCVAI